MDVLRPRHHAMPSPAEVVEVEHVEWIVARWSNKRPAAGIAPVVDFKLGGQGVKTPAFRSYTPYFFDIVSVRPAYLYLTFATIDDGTLACLLPYLNMRITKCCISNGKQVGTKELG